MRNGIRNISTVKHVEDHVVVALYRQPEVVYEGGQCRVVDVALDHGRCGHATAGIADPRQHDATVLAQVAQVRGRRRISHCARTIAEPRPQQRRGVITGKPQSVALVSEARCSG
jgi:hypothetical protein